jgi:membrane protease YdiL (CAAX protease family)
METELRVLVTLGFTLLLVMLRVEAEKFGAAEYDELSADGRSPSLKWRLAWYLTGLLLLVGADVVHPDAATGLLLRLGDRLEAIFYGLAFAAVGTLQAVAFAWLRYRRLRLPPSTLYPGALLNSIATAFLDEAAFRGLLLAFLLGSGMDGSAANIIQAITYVLATRFGGRGRDPYMLVLILIVGLFSGWLTIITGGIGAAFLGHAITRFAIFLATGHAGRLVRPGLETEELEQRRRLPAGWRPIGSEDAGSDG